MLDSISCGMVFHSSPDVAGARESGIPWQVTEWLPVPQVGSIFGRKKVGDSKEVHEVYIQYNPEGQIEFWEAGMIKEGRHLI